MDDSTFLPRVAIGVSLLAGLALWEHRRGRGHGRLREYGFLLGCGCFGVGYALLHDLCTYTLCPDYFVVGKGLERAASGYWPEVVWLAARAGWSAGLVVACVLLLANNPRPHSPQLPYHRLAKTVAWPASGSLVLAFVGGVAGPWALASVADARTLNLMGVTDPVAFLRTWGIHIGSYAGAFAGLLLAVKRVRDLRAGNRDPAVAVPSGGQLAK